MKKRLVKILNRPEHHMVLTVLLILMTTALLGSFSLGKTDAVSDIGFSSENSENHVEKESEPAERNKNKYQLLKAHSHKGNHAEAERVFPCYHYDI